MMDYSKYIGKKAESLQPSGIRKFFDIVATCPGAISLGVGEPDFDTPWESREAAVRSIRKGYTQYSSNKGMPALREFISQYYNCRYGLLYDAKTEIIATVGASEGIDLALRAICNEGDEILVPSPSYVSYLPCVTLAGGKAVCLSCSESNNFRVQAQDIENAITPKTKALVLPYPNNPSGAILEKEDLQKIAQTVIKHDLLVISDEIYSELTYNAEGHVSIASIPQMRERTIVINGFSKAFAMTGWRLGYALAPEQLTYQMYKIHQYTIMCAPTPSQYAGIASLESGLKDNFSTVAEMRKQYDFRRRFVLERLREMGLTCFEPEGAFYAFPSVKSLNMNGDEFANRLFETKKVAVVPGSAFGKSGENNVRISYAYSLKKLSAALSLIEEFVKNHN